MRHNILFHQIPITSGYIGAAWSETFAPHMTSSGNWTLDLLIFHLLPCPQAPCPQIRRCGPSWLTNPHDMLRDTHVIIWESMTTPDILGYIVLWDITFCSDHEKSCGCCSDDFKIPNSHLEMFLLLKKSCRCWVQLLSDICDGTFNLIIKFIKKTRVQVVMWSVPGHSYKVTSSCAYGTDIRLAF